MGQAVKYAVLGAALLAIIIALGVIIGGFGTSDALTGLTSSITSFVSSAGSVLRNVRGALNYVFGSALMTLSIPFWIGVPIAYIGVKITVGVYRWINQ